MVPGDCGAEIVERPHREQVWGAVKTKVDSRKHRLNLNKQLIMIIII